MDIKKELHPLSYYIYDRNELINQAFKVIGEYILLLMPLSFYRSQNVLYCSKFFVPDQKCIYILWQSQTFCARQKDDLHSVKLTYALSFYKSQNVLCRSKFFVPDQKIIYLLWQSQTFCARQIDDLHSVKLVFCVGTKGFEEALDAVKFLGWLKKFGPAQKI